MNLTAFETLPAEARLWIFGATQDLDEPAFMRVRSSMAAFLSKWTAHGQDLRVAFDIYHSRFLIVAVDEGQTAASGCSIDALGRHIREMERELGVELLNNTPVWYRNADGSIETASRAEFRRWSQAGRVDAGTLVFDLTLERLADLRSGRLERPAGQSWHARLLEGVGAMSSGTADA